MAALCKYWAFAFILCQLGQQHMLLNSIGSMGSFFLLGLGALLLRKSKKKEWVDGGGKS